MSAVRFLYTQTSVSVVVNRVSNTLDMELTLDDECEFDSTWEDEYENKTPIKKVCLDVSFVKFCSRHVV